MKNENLTQTNRVRKGVAWLLAILAGLIGLALAYAFLFYPAEYTLRLLRWGDADVYDYQKFPERPLLPSATPFHFTSPG